MRMSSRPPDCWSSHILSAMDGLTRSYMLSRSCYTVSLLDLYWSQLFCRGPRGQAFRFHSYRLWDEALNTAPKNFWEIVVRRPLPPNHLIPTEQLLLFYSPGRKLCVSASIGCCKAQNNILS
jgi:hypothetical protein